MEDTLRGDSSSASREEASLNPCSNGRYSQSTLVIIGVCLRLLFVLILVLMEDTLREQNLRILKFRGFDNSKTYKIDFC